MKCCWAFSTFAIGGPQRRFANLVSAFGKQYEHIIVSMDGCYDATSLLDSDMDWQTVSLEVEKSRGISFNNVKKFAEVLQQYSPDLLLTSNWGTLEWRIANRQCKIPHIHAEDGFGPDEALGQRKQTRDIARQILFSSFATGHNRFAFVAPSHGLANILNKGWGVSKRRVHIIPNGVELSRFMRASDHAHTQPLVVGSVGALRPEKRFDRLLNVFAKFSETADASLLLVGEGPERVSLEALAVSLGIANQVTFAGAQNDVTPFLERMDIYALTSDTEQMPISLVEAMAMRLPVVATDVGDVAQMLSSENHPYVVCRDDEDALVSALTRLSVDAALRIKIGTENSTKASSEFSQERMVESYLALFQMLVTNDG